MAEENLPAVIQGKSVGSKNEARVAIALDKLRHNYIYQFRVFAQVGVRGDYIVDFLVLTTVPDSTPLEVFGNFFHSGQLGMDDKLRLAIIEQELDVQEVKIIWGNESDTLDKAQAAVRKEIGAG